MKNNAKSTTFHDFVTLMPLCESENVAKNIDILNNAEKPAYIFGKEVPQDLNLITFGQYSDICDALGEENHLDAIRGMVKALYEEMTDDDIDDAPAYDVWGLCNFICKETKRINELFSSVRLEYTEQEKKAGIDKLQFGTFGILDWYAKRMGIVDQNAVNNEKWVRIYQCMKNDSDETAYQRRLQKVYEAEARRK